MKHLLLALPLLALGAPALANQGQVDFVGDIKAGTCPIDISGPGIAGGSVAMGDALAGNFKRAGQESNFRDFDVKLTKPEDCAGWDGSGGATNIGTIRFTGMYGGAESNQYFALDPAGSPATNLVLGLKNRGGSLIGHAGDSDEQPLTANTTATFPFTAFYRSTDASVGPGAANTKVGLEVKIN